MPAKRSYAEFGDGCATAHGLELLGDRWNYPILRELMLAPKRFGELAESVRGITPAVLTARLRELETAGLVERTVLPGRLAAYTTTAWAREAAPMLDAIGRWAVNSPTRDAGGGLTPDATLQSMRTMAPATPLVPPVRLNLHLFDARLDADPGYDYRISWDADGFHGVRGSHDTPDATISADSSTWTEILYTDRPLTDAEVTGDRSAVERVLALYRA